MTTSSKFTRLLLAVALAAGLMVAVPLARATSTPWTSRYTLPTGQYFAAISFARQNPLVGYAVGRRPPTSADSGTHAGFILATRDGADTWEEQFACATSSRCTASSPDRVSFSALNAVSFADPRNGYAVGVQGTILATTDGGDSWRPQVSGTTRDLIGVSSPVAGDAHAVSSARDEDFVTGVRVFATTGDGRTWKTQSTGLTGLIHFRGVSFTDTERGVIVGYDVLASAKAVIMSTNNGGSTWSRAVGAVALPVAASSADLTSVSLVGAHGYAVGHTTTSPPVGYVLASTDGGRTWAIQQSTSGQAWESVSFADHKNGRVVGDNGKILATSNSGATWQSEGANTTLGFVGVSSPDVDLAHGYAVTLGSIYGYEPPVEPPTPYPGTWQATSPMLLGRDLHTATPLPDGRVVVIGGRSSRFQDRPDHASAEVYDPIAQRWSHLGNLRTLRARHSATLLRDGRILVAGGRSLKGDGTGSNTQSAEVFDPVSGRSLPTPAMANPQAGHTATLVASGKVLIAGAYGVEEVYDPATNSWSSASARNQVSSPGSATPPAANGAISLETDCGSRCGRVLVVRGASAEFYDPTTNTWSPAASPGLPAGSTAWKTIGLKDGKVMAVSNASNPFVKFYEPSSDTWTAGARPGPEMTGLSALVSVAEGDVLAMFRGNDNSLHAVAYRPGASSWHPVARPWVDRQSFTTTALSDGRVLVAGGSPGSAPPSIPTMGYAEIFDPGSTAPSPPQINELQPSSGRAAGDTEVTISGVAFGQDSEVFFGDVAAKAVTVVSSTQIKAVSPAHSPGVVDVTVRVPGRRTSNVHMHARFTYAGPPLSFGPLPPMKVPRGQHGAVALPGGELLAIGGTLSHEDFVHEDAAGSSELYDPSKGENGEWSLIPRTTTATEGVTQLRDGSVLVAQGDQAEVFSAVSKDWFSVTAMGVPRTGHTSTLLADGRILVAGGRRTHDDVADVPFTSIASVFINGVSSLASAEIYHPQSRTWTPASPMHSARSFHTATLLPDGKVLVAGSENQNDTSAELYDPTTDTWAMTGSLASHHSREIVGATATATANGKVLMVDFGKPPELYDPASGTWTLTAGLIVPPRADHTATALPDGRVLVVGGFDRSQLLLHPPRFSSGEVFDPVTNTWTETEPLETARAQHTATLLHNRVVVVGGTDGSGLTLDSVESSSALPLVPVIQELEPAVGPTLAATVRIVGRHLTGVQSVMFGAVPAEILPGGTSEEIVVRAPAQPQGWVDVSVLAPGGISLKSPATRYLYGAGGWTPTASLPPHPEPDGYAGPPGARMSHTATLLPDGDVLVAGGWVQLRPENANSATRYDHEAGSWSHTGSMDHPRARHSATRLNDGRVLVAGGEGPVGSGVGCPTCQQVRAAELYDPATGKWSPAGSLLYPRFEHTATLLNDGTVLVAGGTRAEKGRGKQTSNTNITELYDPATGQWSVVGPLYDGRVGHTATLLPTGDVLVTGGIGFSTEESFATDSVGIVRSAELYDHRRKLWRKVTPPAISRLSATATLLDNGKVLLAGGNPGGFNGTAAAEVYDYSSDTWSAVGSMQWPRSGHQALAMPDGRVLVVGGGPTFPGEHVPGPLRTAELFDPVTERWAETDSLGTERGLFTATLLGGPECAASLSLRCTQVLSVGGGRSVDPTSSKNAVEVYTPAPLVSGVEPATGPSGGGTPVVLRGANFRGVSAVKFGGEPAVRFEVRSPTEIVAVSPARASGPVEVSVENGGGTSAHLVPKPTSRFVYVGGPGDIADLAAQPISDSVIRLSFTSPGDGTTLGPATNYVVKQSATEIRDEASFAAATSLCEGGVCSFGRALAAVLTVDGLEPDTTYHYAVRALGPLGELGNISNPASATTAARGTGTGGPGGVGSCPAVPEAAPGQLGFPGGKYSLVGLPGGTRVDADGPLYSWFDQGAGGSYASMGAAEPVAEGRGYWAWFACPSVVDLPGAGTEEVNFSLGAYHASMVGNPSTSPSQLTGHDFAAHWDPEANDGVGGYRISGYRDTQSLSVGQGTWVFSYEPTTIRIRASG